MEKQASFMIDCVLNAAGSVLCRQCFDRCSGFELSPAGTLGNAHEYTDLLEWYAETFFVDLEEGEEDEDIVIFNEDVRRVINEVFKYLFSVFVQTVAVHRCYYGLTTNQKSCCVIDYEAFLARRCELPGVNYEKLYLIPGHAGYILWTGVKRSFRTAITEALNWQFEGDNLDDVLDNVLEGWPVITGEL
ncbi:hypothetical protein AnigIFM63604_008694 [Aspergillus niger]|uniref:Uncharacterized protein n=2 Tax=Aspergillus TaxID=5052 RepID=A0A370PMR9_ASPPH|nr:hypothetical protein CBS147346_7811 [Aspergillus niger]RDK43482.1 hypothetical protein M752DRAFT_292653 [Aspergillus phoenicis ATCC 13157]GLA52065.1 hypothetical protein AnigIFM63604_008694 [Aspergillus niger]